MDPLLLFVAPGVIVAADYVRRRRAGDDPLGPRPQSDLPDTAVALAVATLLWFGSRMAAVYFLGDSDVARDSGFAARLIAVTTVNVLIALIVLRAATRGPRRASLPAWKLVLVGVLGALVVFAAQAAVGVAIMQAYAMAGEAVPGQEVAEQAKLARGRDLIAAGLGAIVMAPFAEEVFFRGLLLPALARVRGERDALMLQAVAFGAIHVVTAPQTWPLAIPLAIVGWGAGWFYLRTGSLIVPIVLHAVFNAINFAALRSVA